LGKRIFSVKVLLDDDGEELVDPSESSRFKEARAGNHLMTPFQCELCHFWNIMARNPMMSHAKDWAILEFSRQANLGAFWCRAKSTVASNLQAGLRMEKMADDYGMPSIAPLMGPLPLDDSVGMKVAIAVLDRSLDPGVYSECVQWGTFRKTRWAISNISQAGVSGLQDLVGAYERKHVWISTVVTHQFWFSCFITGIHLRVGEIGKPDELLTIEVVHEIHPVLSREWSQANTAATKRVAEMCTWFVAGFCTGI
jgi:hypothetical protein